MAIARWRPFGALERWDSFGNVSEVQREMNRLFDSFFGRPMGPNGDTARSWTPSVDMRETKDELVVLLEVPGVKDKDVAVSLMGDLLSVKGERRFDEETKDQTWLHVERAHGRFERTIQLPMPVQADKVKATYREGLLEIRLPKAEEVKPRAIAVDIV